MPGMLLWNKQYEVRVDAKVNFYNLKIGIEGAET